MDFDEWDNEDRNRYYGLRVGDLIIVKDIKGTIWGESEVVGYVGDNNIVIIKNTNGDPIDWVAEYCDITTKVEDRN